MSLLSLLGWFSLNFTSLFESVNGIILKYFSNKMYKMYDIYNNAYDRGGQLNINFDRYFVVNKEGINSMNESKLFKSSKYEFRGQMADITIRIGIVVNIFTVSDH